MLDEEGLPLFGSPSFLYVNHPYCHTVIFVLGDLQYPSW